MFKALDKENLIDYAAYHYSNARFSSIEEFEEDFNRLKSLKRKVNLYTNRNKLKEREILNELIVIYNVFDIRAATVLIEHTIEPEKMFVIVPFLRHLNYITSIQYCDVKDDPEIEKRIKNL